jgi:hypothetical protein
MDGKLKGSCVILLAMAVLGASAAQAQAASFHSEKQQTIITGTAEGEQVFELFPGSGVSIPFSCAHADFAGTQIATGGSGSNWTSETATVHPRYYGGAGEPERECLTAGLNLTKIDTNKCHYTLNANTADGTHGQVALSECELGGLVITETVNGITLTVPNQTIANVAHYTNTGTGSTREVTLSTTASSIEWTCKPKAACRAAFGANEGAEATYTGTTTIKGYEDKESSQTTPENNVFANEGAQVGIWWEATSFYSEKEKTILTGTAETAQVFKPITGGSIELLCAHADFAGTQVGAGSGSNWTSETATVHPRYYGEAGNPEKECLTAANPTKFDSNKCHYTLFAETTEGNLTKNGKHANVELSLCELGGILTTETVNGITITVPNQLIKHAVRYTNTGEGATRSITLNATAHGIKWSCKPKAACLAAFGASSGEDAVYTGATTVKGYEDLESSQTTPENNVFANEGAQVGIWRE